MQNSTVMTHLQRWLDNPRAMDNVEALVWLVVVIVFLCVIVGLMRMQGRLQSLKPTRDGDRIPVKNLNCGIRIIENADAVRKALREKGK